MINVVSKVYSSNLMRQILVAIACDLFCISVGWTFGFSAILLPQIKEDENFPYDASYDSWIASSACIAMGIGCIGAGYISDKYGRRLTQLVMSIPYIIGWIILAFANSVTVLIIGRLITGLCCGVFRSLGAVYLGEIANPTNRPLFIFSLSVSATLGIMFCHLLAHFSWRLICFIICLPMILGFGLQYLIKESPLWLIYNGEIDEGTKGFAWYRGNDEASQREITEVLKKQKEKPLRRTFKEDLKLIFSKAFAMPLLTTILMFITVQFSGVTTMSFYAQDVLGVTFSGEQDPFMLMVVTDSARVLGIVSLYSFSKYIPRRKSYVIISVIIVILLVALIAFIELKPVGLAWLAIAVLVLYAGLGSIIIGLSWSFLGEIFPSNLRGLGSGIGASSSFFLLFICVNITPEILKNYGITALYATLAGFTAFGILFLYFLLPHSDGKTLQEIENSYDKK